MARRFFLTAWSLALLVLLCGAARAQQGAPAPLLDRAAVIEAARAVTLEQYPNADDVLVDDHILARYEADGTSVTLDDTYLKVLTDKGKREAETLSFHYTLPYDSVEVLLVEVIKPDGRIVPVDVAAQSREMVEPGQMGSNIYNPNAKVLQVGVPGVEVGDLVHYFFAERIVKPRVPNTWSDYHVFEYTSPIRRYVYEVIAPKDLPLRNLALKDPIEGTVAFERREEDERIRYRWEVRDVPRMYREPSMPDLHTVVQRLLVSTIPDWKTVSKWYWGLCEPHLATTPEIRAKVAELTQDIQERRRKIEALFTFVSQKIRYMGITTEEEAPGYEPHDVKITFENRYGVCRDKAALLVAMLREAGFRAYPVLMHNGPKKDPDVPQPYFNHAVVAVEEPDGGYLLMDPTDENTKDLLPSYLGNQSYLVAKPEGETLRTSPIEPAEKNLVHIETRGRLTAAGGLEAQTVLRFEGINDNAYRGHFARIRPEERRRFFEGRAKQVLPGARLTGFSMDPADMQDTSRPLTVTLSFRAEDVLVSDGKTAMLPLPRWGARVGMVNFILGQTGLEKRRFPLLTEVACGVEETLELDTSAALGDALAVPAGTPIESDALAWRLAVECHDGALRAGSAFHIKVVEFSPQQYLLLKEALKAIEYDARKMPLFAARPAPAAPREYGPDVDAVILDEDVVYDVAAPGEWIETRTVALKVLTYAGVKSNAELKLTYNPAWEELTLEKATVTAPDGTVSEVKAEEQNLMDSAWVGAAPRYPAEKTLVVSLPGVDVGSVIAYRVKRAKKDRPFFAMREFFRGFDPVEHKRVEVKWAGEPPLRIASTLKKAPDAGVGQALQPVHAQPGEAAQHTAAAPHVWEATAMPAITREANLPPAWAFAPYAAASLGDWKAYAAQVKTALAAAAAAQPAAEAAAREAVRDKTTAEAKAIAIRDFVAKNVRAAGPALSALPLATITPADRTLQDGYGNSADRAVLLHAMLNAAGLDAEFVLTGDERAIAGATNPLDHCPDATAFGDVLVRVATERGEVYLNDTDQYAALGATPHDGCLGLDLATGEIVEIRAPEPLQNRSQTTYEVSLNAAGDARILRRRLFFGTEFGIVNKFYAELPPEERRRHHQELVATVSKAAKPDGDLVTRFDAYPGVEEFAVTVEKYAVRDGEFLYFALPASFGPLPGVGADGRANPLYWPAPVRTATRVTVTLPQGAEGVLAPPNAEWTVPGGAGVVRATLAARASEGGDGHTVAVMQETALDPAILPHAAYTELLRIQGEIGSARMRTFLLRIAP